MERQPTTITGSLVPQTSQQSFVPGDDEQKLQFLIRLGSHFWAQDTTPAQAKFKLADYIEDLRPFRVAEIEQFCREWRTDVSRKAFPKVSEIIAQIGRNRRDIAAAETAKIRPQGTSRPICWWMQTRALWKPEWKESEAPDGSLVRDPETGKLRPAYRVG